MMKAINAILALVGLAVMVAGFFVEQSWAIGLGFVIFVSLIIGRLSLFAYDENLLLKP